MTLLQQFQSLVYSFLFSLFFCMIYAFYNRLIYRFRHHVLSYVMEFLLAIITGLGYYQILVYINGGHFNLYMIACLVLGVMVFERWYAFYYLLFLERVVIVLKKYFRPLYFIFRKFIVIMKKSKRVMKRWHKKKEDISQQNQET